MRIRSITAALVCLTMVATLVVVASSEAAVRVSAGPLSSARLSALPTSRSAPVRLASVGASSDAHVTPGRLLVGFAHHTSRAVRERLLRRLGARRVGAIAHLGIVVVDVPPAKTASVLATLKRSPAVAFAERDGVSRMAYTPDDTYYDGSASPCSSSLGCWPYENLVLPSAWDATTGSSSVTVAVVDTGVDGANPDLSGAVLAGYDFVNGTATSAGANSDDNGHGTEAAGIIAARIDNAAGVPGVCGNCKILPVKVLDSTGAGTNSTIAQGITWAADNGANVINLSLASTVNDSSVQTAIDYAIGKGIVVVAAAGNAGSTSPTTSPGGYPAWNATNSSDTTAEGGLISVAAVDYNENLYSFSNHGTWVDVAASGCAETTNDSGGYNTSGFCGTSAAAPFVSGIAALMLSYNGSLTPAQIKTDIDSSAATSSVDTIYGIADAFTALEAAGYTAPAAPSNSSVPTVSGTAAVGQSLTAADGGWSGSPTSYAYQWQSSANGSSGWSAISGATGSSYAIDAADVGDYLRVEVTATNSSGSASADSAATAQVTAAAPTDSAVPTVSGTAQAGQTLTASNGTWTGSPTGYADQWQSSTGGTSWADIAGATGSSYTIDAADVGDYLRVEVTATNAGGSTTADSAATSQVAAASSGGSGGSGGSSGGSGGSGGGSGGSSGGSSGGGGTSGGGPTGTGGTNAPAVSVPDLQVSLTADHASATAGAQIVWRITVSDAADSGDASDVDLDVTLPSGLRLVQSASDLGGGCTAGSGSALVCTLGSIAAGNAGHVTIETTVTNAGNETLLASAKHSLADANPADDTAVLTIPAAAPVVAAPVISGPRTGTPTTSGGGKHASGTVVSGKPRVGSTLIATYKGRGRPVLYRWQVRRVVVVKKHKRIRWKTIHGQTKRRLRVRKAYAGKVVRVVVTYVRNGHRHTKASHPSAIARRTTAHHRRVNR